MGPTEVQNYSLLLTLIYPPWIVSIANLDLSQVDLTIGLKILQNWPILTFKDPCPKGSMTRMQCNLVSEIWKRKTQPRGSAVEWWNEMQHNRVKLVSYAHATPPPEHQKMVPFKGKVWQRECYDSKVKVYMRTKNIRIAKDSRKVLGRECKNSSGTVIPGQYYAIWKGFHFSTFRLYLLY